METNHLSPSRHTLGWLRYRNSRPIEGAPKCRDQAASRLRSACCRVCTGACPNQAVGGSFLQVVSILQSAAITAPLAAGLLPLLVLEGQGAVENGARRAGKLAHFALLLCLGQQLKSICLEPQHF